MSVAYHKEIRASAASNTSGTTNSFKVYDVVDPILLVNVTAVSGTLPTLDIDVEVSADENTWFKVSKFARITGTGQTPKELGTLAKYMRLNYTIGGSSTPTFTFDVQLEGKQ